ncbi:MAG: MFS transporter [Anaerolineae bacterium]|nr:MFS transporter [Anaerolineae bacterium]
MAHKQTLVLFICTVTPMTLGAGFLPLLPVYATQLGADQVKAGSFLAVVYLALTAGSMAAGWMAALFRSRKIPLILAGVCCVPAAWLMGRVDSVWALTLLTAFVWFCGGLGLGLVQILAGLSARPEVRGRVFGLLATGNGLGTLIGGLASGYIADRAGFNAMFGVFAAYMALWPVAAWFVTDFPVSEVGRSGRHALSGPALGRDYILYAISALLVMVAISSFSLMRSLLMAERAFTALAISATAAVSSIIRLPLPLVMGWLSDRSGRKRYMIVGRLATVVSLVTVLYAVRVWHFYLAAAFLAISSVTVLAVGRALITDLVPRQALDGGLALASALGAVGSVMGYAGTGLALQRLGPAGATWIAAGLSAVSLFLLLPIRVRVTMTPMAEVPGLATDVS